MKNFRVFLTLAALSFFFASNLSYGSHLPQPLAPVIKLTEGKATHQCISLFPASVGVQTNETPDTDRKWQGVERLTAPLVANNCPSELMIESVKVAKEVVVDGKSSIERWDVEDSLFLGNVETFLLEEHGMACELLSFANIGNRAKNIFKGKFTKSAARRCRSFSLKTGEVVWITIPDKSLFRISGHIEGKPYVVQARILDLTYAAGPSP